MGKILIRKENIGNEDISATSKGYISEHHQLKKKTVQAQDLEFKVIIFNIIRFVLKTENKIAV